MVKLNKIILSLIVLIGIGILIGGGYYIILGYEKSIDSKKTTDIFQDNNSNQNKSKESYHVSPDGNIEENILNPDIYETNKNTPPAFNVGNRFVYEFPNVPYPNLIIDKAIFFNKTINCFLEYHVMDKIRVNDTAYFKIQENFPKCIVGVWKQGGMLKPVSIGGYKKMIYVSDNTGEIFTGIEIGEKEKISTCYWSGCWYAQWMLKLDDNVKWQEENVYSQNERINYEFSVEGRENIDGRECFEVKKKWNECLNQSCKIIAIELYYIDVEKRVPLKYYLWLENHPVRETILIDQNYFNKTISSTGYEIKTNISEYEKMMRLVNRIGYCEDEFCNPENNETMESCCMDCGCPDGKICNGVCMQDKGDTLEFSSKEYGFNITLPSGWRGKWRGDSIFFEFASEPWTSVEVFFGLSAGKTPQYAYYVSDNVTVGSKNFTLIYSAPAQEDYENNLGLYEKIKSSFRGDLN